MIVSFNSTTRSKVSRRERRKAVALRVVIDFTSAFRIAKNDGLSSSGGLFLSKALFYSNRLYSQGSKNGEINSRL
jgi:hypothetical protein